MFNGTIPAVANQHTGMRPYKLTMGDADALSHLPELRAVTVELARSESNCHPLSSCAITGREKDNAEMAETLIRFPNRLRDINSAIPLRIAEQVRYTGITVYSTIIEIIAIAELFLGMNIGDDLDWRPTVWSQG